MILLTAVAAGTLAGWGFAKWRGIAWQPPFFKATWLVALGFIPQFAAFYFPYTRDLFTDNLASASLVCSQVMLLLFAILNRRVTGMPVLMLGLGCNLAVILANGGFMPLTVEAASRLVNQAVLDDLVIGGRISSASKDILLPDSRIVLPWLADRFVPPQNMFYRFAFSLGDVFVAAGAFWMLAGGRPASPLLDSGDN